MQDVTGFVLAGGKSTRMGRDKALLEAEGQTLLTRALELLLQVAGEVRIVGDSAKFGCFGAVVEDIYQERGPLGGIHAALASSRSELNLMLAVDMPQVTVEFLKFLLARARATKAVVTVPRSEGKFQPLCAVYRREFQTAAESALAAGKNKIDLLFGDVDTLVITEAELTARGFPAEIFRNLNTTAEWEKVRNHLSR